MYDPAELEFNYAIRFQDGTYYTGRAGLGYKGPKGEAFTFTERGAYNKLQRVTRASNDFHGATVERIN